MSVVENDAFLDVHSRLLDHSYRIENMEKLAEQHNEELGKLSSALTEFKEELSKGINKVLVVLVVVLIGAESAAPVMEAMLGGVVG